MPSFGYFVTEGQLYRRWLLVSFSQNSGAAAVPSEAVSASSSSGPRKGCSMSTAVLAPLSAASFRDGLAETSQHQVLLNHAVGSTWIVSASGPALVTWTCTSSSVASSLLA